MFLIVGTSGLVGSTGDVTIRETAPRENARGSDADGGVPVREVYTRDGPGVVSVDVASQRGPGGGSGFVLDRNGHIVTNQHVVAGAEGISVRFASGAREEAVVVGEDPSTDLAVIKVDAPESTLKPLALGDSDTIDVGEPVIAIGNPLNVGISVTTGIVSGVGRPIKAPNNYTISGALQTDAAINPGNSGGPLLDSRGSVIGVNSQIISDTGSFQGVGFAIPSNTVKNVVKQLITTGEVEHGYIGVRMFPVGIEELVAYTGVSEGELRAEHDLPENGAIVNEVTPDGPAARAGIEGGEEVEIEGLPVPIGDVITRVSGEPVSTPDDVIRRVNALKPGDRLELTVVTPGERPRRVEVVLSVRPDGA
ncbi:MAG: trypsin-like peptidase domain-containing protein [Actinomycetota bacterium]|nr:trypsin-like peptidase domain-containing protein [Actinomycetota bacterium]